MYQRLSGWGKSIILLITLTCGRGMGNWTSTRERTDNNKLDPSCSYALNKQEECFQEIPLVHAHPVLSMCAADSTHIITGSNDKVITVNCNDCTYNNFATHNYFY